MIRFVFLLLSISLICFGFLYEIKTDITFKNRQPKITKVYVRPFIDLKVNLNPRDVRFMNDVIVNKNLFNNLLETKVDGTIQGSIAQSWEASDDYSHYKFEVLPNIHFHTGTLLTIEDVAFSFEYLFKNGGIVAESVFEEDLSKNIAEIKIIDKKSLSIKLNGSYPNFLKNLASSNFSILPKNLVNNDNDFFNHPIGTGPFFLSRRTDQEMIFFKNKNYFKNNVFIEQLIFKKLDHKEAIKSFKRNELHDLVFYSKFLKLSDSEYKELAVAFVDGSKFKSSLILFLNNSIPPFNKLSNRLLIKNSIDPEQIKNNCKIKNTLVSTGVIPKGIMGHIEKKPNIIEQKNSKQSIHLNTNLYYLNPDYQCVATEIANYLSKKLNANIDPILINNETGLKLFLANKILMHLENITISGDNPYSIVRYFNKKSVQNLAKIDDESIYDNIKNFTESVDYFTKAMSIYQIGKTINKNAYVVPIFDLKENYFFSNKVKSINLEYLQKSVDGSLEGIWLE